MIRISGLLFAACLAASGVATAAPEDANTAVSPLQSAQVERLEQLLLGRLGLGAAAGSGVCAVAFLPGPAGSFNIQIGVTNFGPQQLESLIIDPFGAFGGRALLINSVFSTVS